MTATKSFQGVQVDSVVMVDVGRHVQLLVPGKVTHVTPSGLIDVTLQDTQVHRFKANGYEYGIKSNKWGQQFRRIVRLASADDIAAYQQRVAATQVSRLSVDALMTVPREHLLTVLRSVKT